MEGAEGVRAAAGRALEGCPPAQATRFLMNLMLVKTRNGWKGVEHPADTRAYSIALPT